MYLSHSSLTNLQDKWAEFDYRCIEMMQENEKWEMKPLARTASGHEQPVVRSKWRTTDVPPRFVVKIISKIEIRLNRFRTHREGIWIFFAVMMFLRFIISSTE